MTLFAGVGTQDPYVSEALAKQERDKLLSRFSHLQSFSFEGEHTMNVEALARIKETLYHME